MLRFLAPALAALAALAYLAAELYLFGRPAFPLDDSWIHLHFARHLADGHGLSYDGETRVTGSTAPLWTALVSIGFAVSDGFGLAWAKLLGIVGFVAAVAGCERLGEEIGLRHRTSTLAAIVVATSPWLVWSALSGMEVTTFTALVAWGLVLHLRERRRPQGPPGSPPRSLFVLAAASLARPEGLLVLVVALADRIVRFEGRTPRLRLSGSTLAGLALVAVVLAPTLAFYAVVGGSPLPTTFAVKAGGGEAEGFLAGLWPNGRYLVLVAGILLRSQPVTTLLALVGAVVLLARLGSRRDAGFALAAWLAGQPLAYAVLANEGGPLPLGNFGRYHFPLLLATAILGVLALDRLASRRAFAALALGVLAAQTFVLLPGPLRYAQTVGNVEDSDVAAARWLAERLPPGAVVAAQDAGALAFFLPEQRLLDLAGIVTPEALRVLRAEDPRWGGPGVYWEERLVRWLREHETPPDVLVVFASSYPALAASPGFERVAGFEVENNVTMAGDALVVLSPPWSRFRPSTRPATTEP